MVRVRPAGSVIRGRMAAHGPGDRVRLEAEAGHIGVWPDTQNPASHKIPDMSAKSDADAGTEEGGQ